MESKIVHGSLINSVIKSKHKVKAHLIVDGGTLDTNTMRLYTAPATVDKTKQVGVLCFKSGSISATANVPRTGFSPGEVIPISVHVNNQSSRQIQVASLLYRRDVFIAVGGKKRRIPNRIAETTSSPIMPGVVTSYEDGNLRVPSEVQMTIPASKWSTIWLLKSKFPGVST